MPLCNIVQLIKEPVPDVFEAEGHGNIHIEAVGITSPYRFDLYHVGVHLTGPEPFRTTELYITRIEGGHPAEIPEKALSGAVIPDHEGHVGQPVLHAGDAPCIGLEPGGIFYVRFLFVDKVPVAALDSETMRDGPEPAKKRDERGIDFLRLDQLLKLLVCFRSLLLKIRVSNQGFFFGEGLHDGGITCRARYSMNSDSENSHRSSAGKAVPGFLFSRQSSSHVLGLKR